MKWISKAKYIEASGLSNGVLRGWFDRYLERGVHYQVIGQTTLEPVRPRLCASMSANLCGFAAMRAAENQWY